MPMRIRKLGMLIAILATCLAVLDGSAPVSVAAKDAADRVFEEPASGSQVRVRTRGSGIVIRVVDRGKLGLQDYLEIAFLGPNGKSATVEVAAMVPDSRYPDARIYRDATGTIANSLDSFVGVSIRLPLGRSPVGTFVPKER